MAIVRTETKMAASEKGGGHNRTRSPGRSSGLISLSPGSQTNLTAPPALLQRRNSCFAFRIEAREYLDVCRFTRGFIALFLLALPPQVFRQRPCRHQRRITAAGELFEHTHGETVSRLAHDARQQPLSSAVSVPKAQHWCASTPIQHSFVENLASMSYRFTALSGHTP